MGKPDESHNTVTNRTAGSTSASSHIARVRGTCQEVLEERLVTTRRQLLLPLLHSDTLRVMALAP